LAFLGVLLATGIDIALPAYDVIAEGLNTSADMSLIITVYVVGMAIGQLIYGPLADRFGRRPAVLSGLVLYVVGAVASALAPSFTVLLIARGLWGLGAAAPAGLRSAITRDLYSGDAMARITTIIMAVFLLGPIFTPLLGEAMLRFTSWPAIFWFAGALAIIGAIWCLQFGETLAEEKRRPLQFSQFRDGIRVVVRTRVTLGHMLANVFLTGAFFIFLGSSQPVFQRVYGRESQFAVLFALLGALTVPPLLLNNRFIERYGSRRMSMISCAGSTALSIVGALLVLVGGLEPDFWVWYVWLVLVSGLITLSSPAITALALEPMGELAGTASSLLFFTGFAFGASLAAAVSPFIDNTVTPFVVGFALYALLGFLCLWWAGGGETQELQDA